MTENRNPRLVVRANLDDPVDVTDELQRRGSPTHGHVDIEFLDRDIEQEVYGSASISEVGPLMEDPDTPTKTSAYELEELRNKSRTTVAQGRKLAFTAFPQSAKHDIIAFIKNG
ncbi:hypothetical protein N0V91_009005 [Didymella pomorum]|uniref:Uncharacterized protein n=1 Tax=Didymella pomorum TaxID=749634 RepID=A0A9W8Z6B4_9PLEO|nr:hypothetical protein N0V91_009005 [Didymella pomorum]